MGLVSALYRLAPSPSPPSATEAEQRLERILSRLIKEHGGAEVRRRIRESTLGDPMVRALLVVRSLTADDEEVSRHR